MEKHKKEGQKEQKDLNRCFDIIPNVRQLRNLLMAPGYLKGISIRLDNTENKKYE